MIDFGTVEDEQIDWENLIDVSDELNFDFVDGPVNGSWDSLNPLPESGAMSIEDIEQLLMNDDSNQALPDEEQDVFLRDVLLDSPAESDPSDEVIDGHQGKDSSSPSSEEEVEDKEKDKKARDIQTDNALQSKDTGDDDVRVVDDDDPVAKKLRRQMRNRDAAVRSRERKKMYVKDLEMKSRYFEAECRRLGMLLQSCLAENQALRLSLHNSKAVDASMTKQESAVLVLESLLLGSLLGLVGIICLLLLPSQFQLPLVAVLLENVDGEGRGNLTLKREGSKSFRNMKCRLTVMGRRCKASRARMKLIEVSASEEVF